MLQTLTAREELFVLRVFEGQGAVQAYRSAYATSGLRDNQIMGKADKILTKEHIARRLKEHRDRAAAAAGIDVAMVLNELVAQAFVDPSRILRTKSYCCRHCHGFDGYYQWLDKREFDQAFARYNYALQLWQEVKHRSASQDKPFAEPEPEAPNDLGGYEFKAVLSPNPHCDHCDGRGAETRDFITDTDKLLPHERRAIAGIKKTKYGVSVELRDRSVPLRMIAEHLGMFVKKVVVQNPDGTNVGTNNAPKQLQEMGSAELEQLKTLLSRALGTSDNSSPTDVVAKIIPDSNNVPS